MLQKRKMVSSGEELFRRRRRGRHNWAARAPDAAQRAALRGVVRCRAGAVAERGARYGPGFSRSGMKNATPRPGHEPFQVNAIAAAAAAFAAVRQRLAGAAGRDGFVRPAAAIPANQEAAAIRVVPAVAGGRGVARPADRVAGPVVAGPAAADARSAAAGRDGPPDFAGAESAAG